MLAAAEAAAAHEAGIRAERLRAETVGGLLQAWLAHQEHRTTLVDRDQITRRTYEVYRRRVDLLRDRLEDVPLHVMGGAILQRYLQDRAAEASPRTLNLELTVMSAAWRWGQKRGVVPDRGLPNLTLQPKGYAMNHRTPEDAEVHQVLTVMEPRARMMIRVLAETGARVGEVADMPPSAIDWRRGELTLDGKTGRRQVPLPAELLEGLRAHLKAYPPRPGGPALELRRKRDGKPYARCASELGHRLRYACDRAGVPRFTPHGLRRAMVRRLRRAGVDVKTAATLMGHSEVVMLKLYDEASPDDLRAAISRSSAALRGALDDSRRVVHGPWVQGGSLGPDLGPKGGQTGPKATENKD